MQLVPFDLDDSDALRGIDEHTKALYLRALVLTHQYHASWPLAIAAVNDADAQRDTTDEAHDAPAA